MHVFASIRSGRVAPLLLGPLLGLGLWGGGPLRAQTPSPNTITQQDLLTNDAGDPLNGSFQMTFEIGQKLPDGFVESKAGGGTATEAHSYRFVAENPAVGTHQFRLQQVDLDGTTEVHAPVTVELRMQQALRLRGPAPMDERRPAS